MPPLEPVPVPVLGAAGAVAERLAVAVAEFAGEADDVDGTVRVAPPVAVGELVALIVAV